MKTAIYIEDGVVQLVITPENDFEMNALKSFEGSEMNAEIFHGSFYDCRGGWTRMQQGYPQSHIHADKHDDRSLILRHSSKETAP